MSEDGENGIEVQYSKLQLLLDEVVGYDPNTISPDDSRSVQESIIRFNVQLQDLDTTMSPEMQDTSMLIPHEKHDYILTSNSTHKHLCI